jgi:hypothetical protein
LGASAACASRATLVRQSTTVPNTSKQSARIADGSNLLTLLPLPATLD